MPVSHNFRHKQLRECDKKRQIIAHWRTAHLYRYEASQPLGFPVCGGQPLLPLEGICLAGLPYSLMQSGAMLCGSSLHVSNTFLFMPSLVLQL